MRILLTTVLLSLVIYTSVNGQRRENGLHFKRIDKEYTWQTASKIQIDSFYYNLNPIETSNRQTKIRISLPGKVIDLSADNGIYEGLLTNVITEYRHEKQKNQDFEQSIARQKVFERIPLDRGQVEHVIQSIIASGQSGIPTDSLIPSWNDRFLHCGSINFQHKINGQYQSQTYFCPWSQGDTVPYKNIIVENYNLIETVFNLGSLYKDFENKLPKGKFYSINGYRMMYIMTNRELANWTKSEPRREYAKSVKNTVDSYINAELKKQKIELKEIDCFENYRLRFGTNGRLKRVMVSKYNRPKLRNSLGLKDFLKDKKEIRKCKRKIEQIFQEIELSFLNLKYEIDRTLSFDHKGEVQLRDDTIY